VGLVDLLLESLFVLESSSEQESLSWLFLDPNARDSTQVRRAKKSFFGLLGMLVRMWSIVGGRRHAWRGTKSVFHGIVEGSWSDSWPSSFAWRSVSGSGGADLDLVLIGGGGGGWLGWSWSQVVFQVREALDGVQIQEVLQVFWNRNRVYCFPEQGKRVEGDGNRTRAEASNCEGDGIWVDPGAAKVFDAVDGQGSLVDGRGENDDRVAFIAKVAEAGGPIKCWVIDDGSEGADAFG
jgi:hypothetical protein